MNLLLLSGVLFAVFTVQIVHGDEKIHFPDDEPERTFEVPRTTTITPVRRNSGCGSLTTKQKIMVYDSDTDSWGWQEISVPSSDGTDCGGEEQEQEQEQEQQEVEMVNPNANVVNVNLMPKPAQVPRPSCGSIKVLVYDSDTDSWEDVWFRKCVYLGRYV